ncbi:MAG: hypothetical protein A2Y25_10835 [Candidatus Melainabacteria bacterium GWF2_37_15]|nr:MAG: hypothetical protein A2Y25_10835 [Candidatus Melainabacteria bacterium GWF2_37_15]
MAGLFKRPQLEFPCHSFALLVLDMQEFFANPDSHAYIPSFNAIVPEISTLIQAFEKNNLPVIFTKHINTEENAGLMGTWWRDIIKEDSIINDFNTSGHVVIEKSQYDAFYNTELENILNSLNIKNLVITGVMTHLCCETTARSAFVRGFNSFFVIDGTATYNERFHRNTVYNLSHGFSVPIMAEELLS